eukprot:1755349-Pyramimonas_sp.AAC.1
MRARAADACPHVAPCRGRARRIARVMRARAQRPSRALARACPSTRACALASLPNLIVPIGIASPRATPPRGAGGGAQAGPGIYEAESA